MTVNSGTCAASCSRSVGDEQVAGEQVVPGVLGDDADRQAVLGIGAGEAVQDEQLFAREGG